MIIDSHCHLDRQDYENLNEIIENAHKNGVGLMVNVATNPAEYSGLIATLEEFPSVYGAFGIHPESIEGEIISEKNLEYYIHHLKIIGIGETGLDYCYPNVPKEVQKESFLVHIRVAQKTGLPLIIHTRDADEDMASILTQEMKNKPFNAVIHCFSSGPELAKVALDLGLYFSFSGILTFKKSDQLRQIAAVIPNDRVLVETDAPFLSPEPVRGRRNEPANVRHTLAKLAQIKGLDISEMEKIVEENFMRLFNRSGKIQKF